MRVLLFVCVSITLLQILDNSISGVSAAVTVNGGQTTPLKKLSSKISAKKPVAEDTPSRNPLESKTKLNKPLQKQDSKFQQGSNTGILSNLFSLYINSLNNLGNHATGHAKNVHTLGMSTLDATSKIGNVATMRASKSINKAANVGTEGVDQFFNTVDSTLGLSKNLVKLKGNVVQTPIHMLRSTTAVANAAVKVPKRLVHSTFNNLLEFMGATKEDDTSEVEPEKEEAENDYDEEQQQKDEEEEPPHPKHLNKRNR